MPSQIRLIPNIESNVIKGMKNVIKEIKIYKIYYYYSYSYF